MVFIELEFIKRTSGDADVPFRKVKNNISGIEISQPTP